MALRSVVALMVTLLLLQAVSLIGGIAPPPTLGPLHPTVLVATSLLLADLLHQWHRRRHGNLRPSSHLSYGSPVALTLILLRVAELEGHPVQGLLVLIGSQTDTLHLSLLSLLCFLLLALLPLIARGQKSGAWIACVILISIAEIALFRLSRSIDPSPTFPPALSRFAQGLSLSEALLFLGLAALSLPLTKAPRLLWDPHTPKVDRLLWAVLATLQLNMILSLWGGEGGPLDLVATVGLSLLSILVVEKRLRPLERAARDIDAPLASESDLFQSPAAPGPTPPPRSARMTSDSASDEANRLPLFLRPHHWMTFRATERQRLVWTAVAIFAVTWLTESLFRVSFPTLVPLWWSAGLLSYYLLLHPGHSWPRVLGAGTMAMIVARLALAQPPATALISAGFNGVEALILASLARHMLRLTLVDRRFVEVDPKLQSLVGFLLSIMLTGLALAFLNQAALALFGQTPPHLTEVAQFLLANLTGIALLTPIFIGVIWKLHFGFEAPDRPAVSALPLTLMLAGCAFLTGRFPFDSFGLSSALPVTFGLVLLLSTVTLRNMLETGLANIAVASALLLGAGLKSPLSYVEFSILVLIGSCLVTLAGSYKQQRTRDRMLRTELLDNSPAMMITMDAQFRITTITDRLCAYLDVPRSVILGKTPATSGFLRLPDHTLTAMRRFIRESPDTDLTLEIDIRRHDGTLRKALAAIRKTRTPGLSHHYIVQITDTTELHRNTRLYKLTLEEGPALLLVQDSQRRTLNATPALCTRLGFSRSDLIGRDIAELTPVHTRRFVNQMRALGDDFTPPAHKVLEFTTAGGKIRKMTAERRLIDPDATGEQPKYIILFTDVTEFEAQRSLTETLLNRNAAVVISQDRNWRIQSVSDAWSEHFGYSRAETLGRDLIDFIPTEDHAASKSFRRHLLSRTRDKETISNTLSLLTKTGERRIVELRSVIEENEDRWLNIIMIVDITEVSLARRKLEHLVAHDELTGLYSRRGFNRLLADGERLHDYDLFLLDLDHFKSVNDTYGHKVGDDLLRRIAAVISEKTGALGHACRVGGEEFAVIRNATTAALNRTFAEELARDIAASTLPTSSGPVSRTVSIGVTRLARTDRLDDAAKWADWALREAKEHGRNKVILTDEAFFERLRQDGRLTSYHDVLGALQRDEIVKYVQPIFDAETHRVVGFEALLRWERLSGEILPPRQFLPQLQNVLLSEDQSDTPRKLCHRLLTRLTACPGAFVSFNIRLEALAFPGAAALLIRNFGPLAQVRHAIVLEICEDAITDRIDMDQAMTEIAILRAQGIRIALDDFGKEASNLNRLTHLPIDIVKIDKSLIERIVTDRRSREALRSVIHLAEALNFEIVAEGVETEAQRRMLLELGLTWHQGFLYARAMPAEQANRLYGTSENRANGTTDAASEVL
ncbi:EAL domain-containing protein [Celeribacter sp. SCSIO 80788]|uniref:EAL domain-containing protein n=1 Tax=Celeribacter sp. SCSIO 80788 TaxID=3117013 RepID=UPI003DA6304E